VTKRLKLGSRKFSLESSKMSELLGSKFHGEIRRGPFSSGLKLWSGGFQLPLRRYISEAVQDRA